MTHISEVYPLPELVNMVCNTLYHLYGNSVAAIKAIKSEEQNTFVLSLDFKSGERRVFHVQNATEFLEQMKAASEHLFAINKEYKDGLYILGVAAEKVLETHYRMHHNEGLVKL